MLSISTMAAAAMLGNVCGTNMANMNQYNAALYDNSNCTQSVCYQNGGQELDTILSRMGVSTGGSQCGLNPGCAAVTAQAIHARAAAAAPGPATTDFPTEWASKSGHPYITDIPI